VTILSRAVRNARAMMRAGEWGTDHVIPSPSQAGGIGELKGESGALAISTVLSSVRCLWDDLTTVPCVAYEGDPNGPRTPLSWQPPIVAEPFGPDVDPADGFGQLIVSRAMRGNGFGFVTARDSRSGLPLRLVVLHPDMVRVEWTNTGSKRFRIGGESYSSRDVVHVTGIMLPGSAAAVDILTAQRVNMTLAAKVGEYAEGFFGSGGSPSGVIEVPGAGDRKKAREIKGTWESDHGGIPNAHRPAVLFGGAKWTQLSVSPENAQFLETRAFMRDEIAGLYGVPTGRILGTEYDVARYTTHGLLPPVRAIERVWNRLLPGGATTWVRFDLDTFLRADAKTRAQVAQIHRVTAVRTPDEIRADEGWSPFPDGVGADPFTPLNSNTSPTGGEDNAPNPGGIPGPDEGGPS
jgi:HK97 family phage portal protein